MPKQRPDPLVRIAVANGEVEAILWQNLLRERGIAAMVRTRDPMTSMYGTPSLVGYELYVKADDEQQASRILATFEGTEPPPELPEGEKAPSTGEAFWQRVKGWIIRSG